MSGGLRVGDEVFGLLRFPSYGKSAAYAEYVAAPASDLALKPAGLDHVHAAGAPMAGLTAWQFLIDLGHDEPNPLQPERHRPALLDGRRVLVNGAAGGVGHIAVQLAKWQGAHVTAVASSAHEAFLRDLGADAFIDYTRSPPEDVAHDLDLVLDTLGGPSTGRFLRTLKRGGALFPVFLGFRDAGEAAERGVTVSMTQVRSNGVQLAELGRLLDVGTVRVAIDGTFPLAEARLAHERARPGAHSGQDRPDGRLSRSPNSSPVRMIGSFVRPGRVRRVRGRTASSHSRRRSSPCPRRSQAGRRGRRGRRRAWRKDSPPNR